MGEQLLLNRKESGRLLRVSERRISQLQDAQIIPPPVKIGRKVFWRKSDLCGWIENGCVPWHKTQKRK